LLPDSATGIYSLKHDVERAGFTSLGFGLGLRRLLRKGLIESVEGFDERHGEAFPAARLTSLGWSWIEANEKMFSLKKRDAVSGELNDDIPF